MATLIPLSRLNLGELLARGDLQPPLRVLKQVSTKKRLSGLLLGSLKYTENFLTTRSSSREAGTRFFSVVDFRRGKASPQKREGTTGGPRQCSESVPYFVPALTYICSLL